MPEGVIGMGRRSAPPTNKKKGRFMNAIEKEWKPVKDFLAVCGLISMPMGVAFELHRYSFVNDCVWMIGFLTALHIPAIAALFRRKRIKSGPPEIPHLNE
jgi:hypothetical protein